ncbi:Uncharacterised protein [[Clostridium] sordellii]|uniref:hypothetical protein n=1 Tax=Paraclostridium sordellii TaxID=1505 RepID=UPI0005E770A1|nr:hypothetical protein [Paeniclostridium sordellii]MDU2148216.1 hypothetical protein [Paeniclostridium sordellii]MDU6482353.1 hypothetical protein [Paeniclostridium sordellii]CEP89819.1 Uncharacterised protein [[Clostridium] sordellii] [Paeniclostridium sordellii]CEQ20909.1 Uncharacterised protein [[Clostridium] sordellii] [Paeniclostridium sordellii]CEQ30269.1 Uncharacterised protein [[Clostridium] sordellii] [Paeniclostridium sordellii]
MKIYLHYKEESFEFNGFYLDDFSDKIPKPNILIDKELWETLQKVTGDIKLKKDFIKKEIYTISDFTLFEIIPIKSKKHKLTKVDALEEQNANLTLSMAIKDSQIEQLNQTVSDLVITVAQLQGGK